MSCTSANSGVSDGPVHQGDDRILRSVGWLCRELGSVVDLDTIRRAGVRIGAEAVGGASSLYWQAIAERHRLDITRSRTAVTAHDGMPAGRRMYSRALVKWRTDFDIAVGNDADAGRHAIVTERGLMNPNEYLAAAIDHLLGTGRGGRPMRRWARPS